MFKWTMVAQVNASYTVRINSTVFYTLNTSGVAPQTYPDANGPPHLPGGGWYRNASLNTPSLYPGGGDGASQGCECRLSGSPSPHAAQI
eukprot:COSAG05_NODE_2523_length_2946_cov_5.044335_3_plen_89_part_00